MWRDNSRTLTGWQHTLWVLAGNLALVRRLIGGRWERWWTDVVFSFIWYPVTDWGDAGQQVSPAPICRGKPEREDYTPRPCAACGQRRALPYSDNCGDCDLHWIG